MKKARIANGAVTNFSKICFAMGLSAQVVEGYLRHELGRKCELVDGELVLTPGCASEVDKLLEMCAWSLKCHSRSLCFNNRGQLECSQCKRKVKLNSSEWLLKALQAESELDSKVLVSGEFTEEAWREFVGEGEVDFPELFARLFERVVDVKRCKQQFAAYSQWFAAILFEIPDSDAMVTEYIAREFPNNPRHRLRLVRAMVEEGLLGEEASQLEEEEQQQQPCVDNDDDDEDYVYVPQEQEDEEAWVCV
ncbi:hypothetical protein BASA81_009854 [Batrachochytrium salamandrivorans]|nr:hypothetical protein BASA81_009854 [Batrachochytrium salamandrivorans]